MIANVNVSENSNMFESGTRSAAIPRNRIARKAKNAPKAASIEPNRLAIGAPGPNSAWLAVIVEPVVVDRVAWRTRTRPTENTM